MRTDSLTDFLFPSEFQFYDIGTVQSSPAPHQVFSPISIGFRFEFLGADSSDRVFGYLIGNDKGHEEWMIELGNTIASRLSDRWGCFLSPPKKFEFSDLKTGIESQTEIGILGIGVQTGENLIKFDFILTKEGRGHDQIHIGNT